LFSDSNLKPNIIINCQLFSHLLATQYSQLYALEALHVPILDDLNKRNGDIHKDQEKRSDQEREVHDAWTMGKILS
jgi:hypothetical protein